MSNYPKLESQELSELALWARTTTPVTTVFQFLESGKDLQPGVFRVRAMRPVYVDWKAGGQVNLLPSFGGEWWRRWQSINGNRKRLDEYQALGIQYIVCSSDKPFPGAQPAFRNGKFLAYSTFSR
jgi:hypothetical protein